MAKVALFIDGENISANRGKDILQFANKQGKLISARVYGIKNDNCTKKWIEIAEKDERLKDIRLAGKHKHNKVDSVIKKEALDLTSSKKNVDIIIIASNDHGYSKCIEVIMETGKRVYVIGNGNAAKILKSTCTSFFCI